MTVKVREYSVSPGGMVSLEDAQAVGELLEQIKGQTGGTETQDILDYSKGTILDKYFEWDNEKAANSWRLHQARNIINHIVVWSEELDCFVKAFHNIKVEAVYEDGTTEIKRVYVHVSEMKDPPTRENIVAEALQRFRALRKRYREVKELAKLFEEIDNYTI